MRTEYVITTDTVRPECDVMGEISTMALRNYSFNTPLIDHHVRALLDFLFLGNYLFPDVKSENVVALEDEQSTTCWFRW